MATFGVINRFPGGTKDQYEAARAQIWPPGGRMPEGMAHHIAGATDDGWVVVALWDSRESYERFRDDRLIPVLQGMGEAGLPSPPQTTTFEVQRELQGT